MISFQACRKDSPLVVAESSETIDNILLHEFFTHHHNYDEGSTNLVQTRSIDTGFILEVQNKMAQLELESAYLDQLVELIGYPHWETTMSGSTESETKVLIVPYSFQSADTTNAQMVVLKENDEFIIHFEQRFLNQFGLNNGSLDSTSINLERIVDIENRFRMFDNAIFDKDVPLIGNVTDNQNIQVRDFFVVYVLVWVACDYNGTCCPSAGGGCQDHGSGGGSWQIVSYVVWNSSGGGGSIESKFEWNHLINSGGGGGGNDDIYLGVVQLYNSLGEYQMHLLANALENINQNLEVAYTIWELLSIVDLDCLLEFAAWLNGGGDENPGPVSPSDCVYEAVSEYNEITCLINSVGADLYNRMADRDAYRSDIKTELLLGNEYTQFAIDEYQQTGQTNPKVYYNLYGYKGINRWINGEWVHTRWNYYHDADESFVYRNGTWDDYDLPSDPKYNYANIISAIAEIGHFALDCGGLVPGFGEIFDGINAVWYYNEGDYVNSTLSTVAMIPFAGYSAVLTKWTKNLMYFARIGNLDVWVSQKGLKYIINYSGESRIKHVLRHTQDNVNKPIHGVFDDPNNVFGIIDEAWQKKIDDGLIPDPNLSSNAEDVFIVNLNRRIGWEGGSVGAGRLIDAEHVVIVVKKGTKDVVSSYPYIP